MRSRQHQHRQDIDYKGYNTSPVSRVIHTHKSASDAAFMDSLTGCGLQRQLSKQIVGSTCPSAHSHVWLLIMTADSLWRVGQLLSSQHEPVQGVGRYALDYLNGVLVCK